MNDTAVFRSEQSRQQQITRSANETWKPKHATGAKRGKTIQSSNTTDQYNHFSVNYSVKPNYLKKHCS